MTTVKRTLQEGVARFGERLATLSADGCRTFAEIDVRANALANGLMAMGVKKGDRVAVLSQNCPEYREAYFACAKAGLTAMPLNYRLASTELLYIVNDSMPRVLIAGDGFQDTAESLRAQADSIQHLVSIGQSNRGVESYENLVSSYPCSEPDIEVDGEDVLWIMYTSGTTGRPKGAMLTQHNVSSCAPIFAKYLDCGADSVFLAAMPLHGSAGALLDYACHVLGSATVVLKRFNPVAFRETTKKYGVTSSFLVPSALNFVFSESGFDPRDLSSMRKLIYTGAPMPPELLKKAMAVLGTRLTQFYGSTEMLFISALCPEDHTPGSQRLASCGRPVPGVQVRIVDDKEEGLPVGSIGEIVVKSEGVMKGYLGLPEATSASLTNGWFNTGDLGFIDKDSYLYLVDRKKDMIISGGFNIYPREVEDVISSHPSVLEVAVIGVPDPEWGEAVKAVVVPISGNPVTAGEIIEFCARHLASYKKPKTVDFVDALPRNASGKVLKRELRTKYAGA